MKTVTLLLVLVVVPGALGYEVATHDKLSREAVEGSVLTLDPLMLSRLGLSGDLGQTLPSPAGVSTITGLVSSGAVAEDDGVRFLNHLRQRAAEASAPTRSSSAPAKSRW